MTDKTKSKSTQPETRADHRKARLAEALRANLQKRKAQLRSRRTGEADQRPDGLAAASTAGRGGTGAPDERTGED